MADLRKLIRDRGLLKSYYTRMQTRLNNFEDNANKDEELHILTFRIRDPRFYNGLKLFNKIQTQIEELDPNMEVQEQERENFENTLFQIHYRVRTLLLNANLLDDDVDKFIRPIHPTTILQPSIVSEDNQSQVSEVKSDYFQAQASATAVIPDGTQPNIQPNINSNVQSSALNNIKSSFNSKPIEFNLSTVKLPPIKLPTFSGEYQNWLNFRDSFKSLIHENSHIPTILKFHRLLSLLSGEALLIVKSIEISESNYSIAWNLLMKRYEQENFIIDNHIKAILDLEPIQRESFSSLQQLTNSFNINIGELKSLVEPILEWNSIIIYIIKSKFDSITKSEWAKVRNKLKDRATLLDLQEFLSDRCNLLESVMTLPTNRKSEKRLNSKSYI